MLRDGIGLSRQSECHRNIKGCQFAILLLILFRLMLKYLISFRRWHTENKRVAIGYFSFYLSPPKSLLFCNIIQYCAMASKAVRPPVCVTASRDIAAHLRRQSQSETIRIRNVI